MKAAALADFTAGEERSASRLLLRSASTSGAAVLHRDIDAHISAWLVWAEVYARALDPLKRPLSNPAKRASSGAITRFASSTACAGACAEPVREPVQTVLLDVCIQGSKASLFNAFVPRLSMESRNGNTNAHQKW